MDLTSEFWELTLAKGALHGLDQERLTELRASQILRSHASKSTFIIAAAEVNRNIDMLRSYIATHCHSYMQPGKMDDTEKQKVDEQVGLYTRSCSEHIQRLENTARQSRGSEPQNIAHMHGVALILSERLQLASAKFDACRSVRYNQLGLQKQQQMVRVKRLKTLTVANRANGQLQGANKPSYMLDSPRAQAQAQQQLPAESLDLRNEIQSLGRQVEQTEQSMLEIASLNQMFSAQVMQQSEATQQLYDQAVEATHFISSGNVHLEKSIRLNSSTRKILFVFFLVMTAILLYFDWLNS